MMIDISVVVPVYNVEKYLSKCIDSVLKQSLKNIELILVDDGSSDSSGNICDEYAKKDSRIHVIHQENRGLSAARNVGISIAKGEHIAFVDSDDYIDSKMYEILLENITTYNADMATCGITDVFLNKKTCNRRKRVCKTISRQNAIECLFSKEDCVRVFAWNKLYKRKVFDKIRYPEGKLYEDAHIIYDVLNACDIISVTSEPLYYYVHRFEGISNRKFIANDLDGIEAAINNTNI